MKPTKLFLVIGTVIGHYKSIECPQIFLLQANYLIKATRSQKGKFIIPPFCEASFSRGVLSSGSNKRQTKVKKNTKVLNDP